jgi:hypothetical protein
VRYFSARYSGEPYSGKRYSSESGFIGLRSMRAHASLLDYFLRKTGVDYTCGRRGNPQGLVWSYNF